MCPDPVCAALPPACWRDTWCDGFALSFLLPIWHLFDHCVRMLWILFPIAFPAQIKGRICYLGFVSLHWGPSVSICCNLQPAVAFLHVILGSDGQERLLVLGFAQHQRNRCSEVDTYIKSITTNKYEACAVETTYTVVSLLKKWVCTSV